MQSKPLLTAMRIALHTSVFNERVNVTNCLSVRPHRLSALFGPWHSLKLSQKHCLQSLSAIILCCELCQPVPVHKQYTDPLRLYRHGFDITEYTAFPYYTHRQGLKLRLDWELSRTLKLVMESELVSEFFVHLNQLTLMSVWEGSIVQYVGLPLRG